jgi:hypothetical protein
VPRGRDRSHHAREMPGAEDAAPKSHGDVAGTADKCRKGVSPDYSWDVRIHSTSPPQRGGDGWLDVSGVPQE